MTTDRAPAATETAWLAAEIALDQPSLLNSLRHTSARVCRYGGLLEAELGHFRQLEPYLDRAVRHVEARTGQPISDELHARLCDSLGVSEVRIVLERIKDAHPDTPREDREDPGPVDRRTR